MSDEQTRNIRLQPVEVEVPPGEPFRNDKLHRKESIEALTNVLRNIEGPGVVAVDAGWGMGKTTFLRMWAQHLRSEDFPVVEFNAWQTDFAEDPFIALSSELSTGLGTLTTGPLRGKVIKLATLSGRVAARGSMALLRTGVSIVPGAGNQLAKEMTPKAKVPDPTPPALYDAKRALLHEFRSSLEDIAASLSEHNHGRPMVVLIDELDRCRPTYAIELLEAARHFFSVDRIVFVLCLDRLQLAQSIKVIYGDSFDSDGYLRRFFDVDYRLPEPHRRDFVDAVLRDFNIKLLLQRENVKNSGEAVTLLTHWLERDRRSLRQSLQAVHRLALVLAASNQSKSYNGLVLIVLAILKSTRHRFFIDLLNGATSDTNAINNVFFSDPALQDLRSTKLGRYVEGILIASVALYTCVYVGNDIAENSEMLPRLSELREQTTPGTAAFVDSIIGRRHAEEILRMYNFCCNPMQVDEPDAYNIIEDRIRLEEIVRYLEHFQPVRESEAQ